VLELPPVCDAPPAFEPALPRLPPAGLPPAELPPPLVPPPAVDPLSMQSLEHDTSAHASYGAALLIASAEASFVHVVVQSAVLQPSMHAISVSQPADALQAEA